MKEVVYMDNKFKALADPTRRQILQRLIQGETCGCTLIEGLDMTQPTLSYHMQVLSDAKLVSYKKEGTWKKYTVNEEEVEELIDFLVSLKVIS